MEYKSANRIPKLKALEKYDNNSITNNKGTKPNGVPDVTPNIIVTDKPNAQVTVAPDDNNKNVFNNGIPNGFIASIPIGGHNPPNSISGTKAAFN
ncbi:hypothetical protein BB558_007609 [Smittium angustum]|uniref:Uncharacterized protein n=1 Tax=Smittium angustum TaxID=133377 RepID=A0A2U1IUL9_SMIAN|nr:hypothetical protein BB558_007588 [Smittium angustum]PVZ96510.1 hypothetical protein BB558_007609 [Smittium angustum]